MKIKHYLLIGGLLLVAFLGYATLREMAMRERYAYQAPVPRTVKEIERASPADYLMTKGNFRKNFIGQWVLEGRVFNKATRIKYKDAVLEVSYYSRTETLLGSDRYTMYEYYKPGKSKRFKLKTKGYSGTASIGLALVDAVPVN